MTGNRLLSTTPVCQAAVERQLGRSLLAEEQIELSRLVNSRARKLRLAVDSYASRLSLGELEGEALGLAARFTIGESYFFRDLPQLRLCRDLILERANANPGVPVRVLSAGCSTGDEIYSVVMLLSEQLPAARVDFQAIDLNVDAIARAQRGRYTNWALRETPASFRDRWFEWADGEFVLAPSIREKVKFHRASLASPASALPRHGYDVILCRNVLMYFSELQYRTAARRLEEALCPGGYLFLGHAESMRGSGLPLELLHAADSFCYRKTPLATHESAAESFDLSSKARPMGAGFDQDTATKSKSEVGGKSFTIDDDFSNYSDITRLVRGERFAEALQALEQAGSQDRSPRAELCKSLLLVYTNRFEAASELANTLIGVEGVATGAHYVLATCHEFRNEVSQAREHVRRSTYLDPTFAMAWLHLGMLSKRLGDSAAARRELLQARALLAVEPSDRLVWFGGGCSRATLMEACAGELASTGALP